MAPPRKSTRSAPSECPVCGAAVPPNARACPDCGADERTGWDEDTTRYDSLDLPDEAFEEDDACKEDHPRPSQNNRNPKRPAPRVNGIAIHWWLFALLVIAALVASALGLRL